MRGGVRGRRGRRGEARALDGDAGGGDASAPVSLDAARSSGPRCARWAVGLVDPGGESAVSWGRLCGGSLDRGYLSINSFLDGCQAHHKLGSDGDECRRCTCGLEGAFALDCRDR